MSTTRTLSSLPAWTALLTVLTAGPLGYLSRDFGFFLLMFLCYLPALGFFCLLMLIGLILDRQPGARRSFAAALAVILLVTPAVLRFTARQHDRIAFFFWYPTHQDIVSGLTRTAGSTLYWDGWGWGGISSDAFLVWEPSDQLSERDAAAAVNCKPPDCGVLHVERMQRGFYIVTEDYP